MTPSCIRPTYFLCSWNLGLVYVVHIQLGDEPGGSSYSDLGSLESFHTGLGMIPHFDLSDNSLNTLVDNRACNCMLATQISFLPFSVMVIVTVIIKEFTYPAKDSEPCSFCLLSSCCYLNWVHSSLFLTFVSFSSSCDLKRGETFLCVSGIRQYSLSSSVVLSFQNLVWQTPKVSRTCWAH